MQIPTTEIELEDFLEDFDRRVDSLPYESAEKLIKELHDKSVGHPRFGWLDTCCCDMFDALDRRVKITENTTLYAVQNVYAGGNRSLPIAVFTSEPAAEKFISDNRGDTFNRCQIGDRTKIVEVIADPTPKKL